MANETNGLREDLSVLKDDELRKIIYVENAEYEQEAIHKVKKELFSRESGHIWESDSIILRDLIRYADSDEIKYCFLRLFPEEIDTMDEYANIIELLLNTAANTEESASNSISIIIDDQSRTFANKNWNVYGKEVDSSEDICLDYFYKAEWLNFKVLKEQLQKFGIETYIAYCVRAMTAIGFNDDEIQDRFNSLEKNHVIKNLQELYPTMADDKSGIFIMDGLPRAKKFIRNDEDTNNYPDASQIRPLVRFFARTIDYSIWIIIIDLVWLMVDLDTYAYALSSNFEFRLLTRISFYILWMFVEALLLSKTGYTLGKWILKVRVTDKNGEKLTYMNALKRAVRVFIFGCAMEIPYASTVTYIIAYNMLMKNGITKWDKDGNTIASHSEYSTFRGIIAVILFILPTLFAYLSKYF